jgi:glycosyltransferase involved in cell wall biosynthesis
MSNFLLVDPVDFTRPIFGSGGASVIASAMNFFKGKAYLVGITSENQPLGIWSTIKVDHQEFRFLPVMTSRQLVKSKSGSANIDFALNVFKFRKALKEVNINHVFTQTYSVLWCLNLIKNNWSICFYYPGLGNPMLIGRKPGLGKFLSHFYNFLQGIAIRKAQVVFAAASQQQIDSYNAFLKRIQTKTVVKMLPTAVNMNVFKPQDKDWARSEFGIARNSLVLCFVGRLALVKGIPLVLEALKIITQTSPDARLLLVGDGEERQNLVRVVESLELHHHVIFLGNVQPSQVALAIAAADVCVVSSFTEGFSCAMVEQVACGRPIVSTHVSGAQDLIAEGVNGYIVHDRDPGIFAQKILDASRLIDVEDYSVQLVQEKYSEEQLWQTVSQQWLVGEESLCR